MYRMKWIVSLVLVVVLCAGSTAWAQTAGVKLKEGIYQETTGNLSAAITIYQEIIDDEEATAFYAATAMYRLGMCQLKGGDKKEAAATFEQVIAKYPSESVVVEKAQEELVKLNSGSEIPENATVASPDNLQELIDAAEPNDTIILSPGLYTEPVIITKHLTVRGESRADCVFDVTADQPAIMIDFLVKGKVKLKNLTIKAQRKTMDKGGKYYDYRGAAVGVKDSRVEIEGCFIKALGDEVHSIQGMYCQGFSDVTITRCRFEGYWANVRYGAGSQGKVQDCLLMNGDLHGIMIYQDTKVEVLRNVICEAGSNGIRCTGGGLHVKDNLIINNQSRGVYLGSMSVIGSIINNVIMGNAVGIGDYADPHQVVVENNVILNNHSCGINLKPSSRFTVQNNIFQGNKSVVVLVGGNEKYNSTILSNTLWDNTADFVNFAQEPESFKENPVIVDPDNGYFAVSNPDSMAGNQGLTDPEEFTVLWLRWQNRYDVNEPFGVR